MKHINFIENKPIISIKPGRFELDYFVMILIVVGLLAAVYALHLIQDRRLSSYQQELALIRQSMAGKPEEKPGAPIVGIAWSDWLTKYSAEFPRYIRLNKITGSTKNGRKILLEASGLSAIDASRAKRNLMNTGLCQEVEVNQVNQSENGVTFELECKLL